MQLLPRRKHSFGRTADQTLWAIRLDVDIDREAAGRYGIRIADVNEVIQTAIGGMRVSETVEGRERYPISVMYARDFRDDPEQLGRALVTARNGAQIPLRQVATIQPELGPPMIRSEDGRLVGYVFVDTGQRRGQAVLAANLT